MSVTRQHRSLWDNIRSPVQIAILSPYTAWGIVVVFIVLGIMVSLKTPLYQGSDEGWHYAYVEHYALGRPLPDYTKHFTTGDPAAPYWQTHEASQPPLYYIMMGRIAAIVPRGDLMQEQVLGQDAANGMYGNFLPADDGSLGSGFALAGHLVRFATVLFGAGLVICSYYIARMITGRPEVALLTTALVAFNPHNLMLSGAISNDIPVACMAALTLLVATRIVTTAKEPRPFLGVLLGVLAGLTLLTKYSGGAVAIAAPIAILCRAWRSRYSFKWIALLGAAFAAGALLTTGAYFAHNWLMYGDFLAWNEVNKLMPPMAQPRAIQAMLDAVPFILSNFFSHPGYMLPIPDRYNRVMLYLFIAGMAGAIWLLARRKLSLAILPLLLALAINTGTFILWLRTHADTENMRFFTPTLIPITLLVAAGLLVFIPQKIQRGLIAVVVIGYGVFTALTLYDALNVMYAYPHYLTDSEAQTILQRPASGQVAFDNGIQMLDVQLANRRVDSGTPVEITIVWRTTVPLTRTAQLMLDLRREDGTTAAYLNTANAVRYAYLTRAWQVGRPVRETYQITVDTDKSQLLQILAGWNLAGGGAIHLAGSPAVSVEIGRVKVRAPQSTLPPPALTPPVAQFVNFADLMAARIDGDGIILSWRATSQPDKNYKVFVHGLDANGKTITQNDVLFDYSAAYWDKGDTFEQRIPLAGQADATSVVIGVYDPDTGQRIHALKPDGTAWPDDSATVR